MVPRSDFRTLLQQQKPATESRCSSQPPRPRLPLHNSIIRLNPRRVILMSRRAGRVLRHQLARGTACAEFFHSECVAGRFASDGFLMLLFVGGDGFVGRAERARLGERVVAEHRKRGWCKISWASFSLMKNRQFTHSVMVDAPNAALGNEKCCGS
ncbi:uncharacterized protein EV422DRAFT_536036 [Fimicolochytrium jonesii]|uniref:uncharacterized protein n=1 Tax=Fimicolochytrium jonesii TaxID=1396493 RepID=UPI0022FDB6B9|nr:uncharacterized protein EV422DRAFT_536036 [Fimicolochytrium jonesii]KAI8818952.1 hypothetical protein EV422DRAFT_536036 [Fimicolochytrium jonesii]